MLRAGRVALAVLLVLLTLTSGTLAWIAWLPDTLRHPVERLLSASLGREVRIDGPLMVSPGRITTVELLGLHVAAPAWAKANDVLAVDRLRVGLDLWAYLRHRAIKLTELTMDAPRLALERNRELQTSWPAGGGGEVSPMPALSVGTVEIDEGRIEALDAPTGLDLTATLTVADARLKLDGSGKVGTDPLQVALHVGSFERLVEGQAPLKMDGAVTLAATRLELSGQIAQPSTMTGVELALAVAAQDPSRALALLGLAVRDGAPRLDLQARLTGGAKAYVVQRLHLRWGESAVDGDLRLDLAGTKPRLDGSLRAPLLDISALLPLFATQEAGRVELGNPLQALAGYEADLRLEAAEIRLPAQLALHDSAARIELADDRLQVTELRIGLPEGAIAGEMASAALNEPELTADVQLEAKDVGVGPLAGDGYRGKLDGRLHGALLVGPWPAMLAHSRLRFEGRGEELLVPQAELGSLALTATLADGRLRLDPVQAKLPEGTLQGRVTAGPFDRDFSAELDLNASGIDLAAASRVEGVAGRLDGRVTGTLHGTAPLDMLTRSRLELTGTIDGLELPQIERRVSQAKLTLDPVRREALRLVAAARAGDRPLALTAFGGSIGTLAQNRGEYPFTIDAELGRNEVQINGTMTLPLTERNFTAKIRAKGPDPSPILALFELPKLQFPPYRLTGTLATRGGEVRLSDFDGHIGDSDVAADLVFSATGERPKISGRVRSQMLDADDLGGLVGATPATGPGETASIGEKNEAKQIAAKPTVLPDEPIDPSRWRKVDFDLELRAARVQAGKIPLDGFSGKLTVEDGRLVLDDLDLQVGEGHATGRIVADGRKAPVAADLSLDLQRIPMARLLNRLDVDMGAFGVLSGRARGGIGMGGEGFSIKEMLARSNGKVELLMEGGQIDRTIVAGLGLDLLRLLGAAVGATPDSVELRCAVASLDIGDGIVRTDPVVMDTEIADVGGRGTINLKDETIDVSLTAKPRGTPLLTDLTGISIGGTLGEPQLNINPLAIAARGVAAATLGVVLKPFTALAGAAEGGKPSPCADLLRQQSSGAGG